MPDISPQIEDITNSFISSGIRLSIGYVEIITRQEEAYKSIHSAVCMENFVPITLNELQKNPGFSAGNPGENREFKGKNSKNQDTMRHQPSPVPPSEPSYGPKHPRK